MNLKQISTYYSESNKKLKRNKLLYVIIRYLEFQHILRYEEEKEEEEKSDKTKFQQKFQ